MTWWKKGLLLSIVWFGLTIGAGILHTDFVLAGRVTPEQDAAISYRYGVACGLGLIVIWAISLYRGRPDLARSPLKLKSTRFVPIAFLIAASVFGVYSFASLTRKTHIRAIDRGIGAAFEEAQKLPPGHERGQDILKRLKAIDMGYAPSEMKQAVADYITAFQKLLEATEAGRDLSTESKAMSDARDRIIAIEKEYN